jgi:ATP-dependent DNA helicase RecG
MELNEPISVVKNIGETRCKQLNKMGVETVNDLIEYFPRDYEDKSLFVNISDVVKGEVNTFKAKVSFNPEAHRVKGMVIVRARLSDATGSIDGVWFNQPYIKNSLVLGKEYVFSGKVTEKYNRIQIESPEFEVFNPNSLNNGRIVPVYTLPARLSQKVIRTVIRDALVEVKDKIDEFLPESIMKKMNLCSRLYAIKNIHFPQNDDAFFKARYRLVAEELLLLQMRLLQLKGDVGEKTSTVKIGNYDVSEIRNQLKFDLTNAQKKVLNEIFNDFSSGYVMNRLVQGDVGCGKTAVAMIAAYLIINNGYQAVMMAPTDVLANQHYESFKAVFEPLGISCQLLTSGLKKKEKNLAYENIENGNAKMIIGTHALIQEKVVYNNLGLVITDEQHRFGVRQREMLAQKGEEPHVLVMTATPIPRTLALILYGDLDISTINELPPGRQKVDTFAVNHTYDNRLYDFIEKEVAKGRQCYIICPMIEENEKLDLRSVLKFTEELQNDRLPSLRVECMHGKLKNNEKQDIMDRFSNGEIDVLVSTTVIEVGVNVPNATLMIIENAERFGLSALHQLRGRVGRGGEKSYCVLVTDSKTKVAKERMSIMCKSNDGFVISEKDLHLRGPGDFFGTRQHGLPEMKIANLYKDINILKDVQSVAIDLYKSDENLEKKENLLLKKRIEELYSEENKKICL